MTWLFIAGFLCGTLATIVVLWEILRADTRMLRENEELREKLWLAVEEKGHWQRSYRLLERSEKQT